MIQLQQVICQVDAITKKAALGKALHHRAVGLLASAVRQAVLLSLTAVLTGLLPACGGGAVIVGDGVSATLNVPPASGNGTEVLSVVVQEPAGRNCARGGSRVESGLDLNRNQVLEFSEINTTRYVCNV